MPSPRLTERLDSYLQKTATDWMMKAYRLTSDYASGQGSQLWRGEEASDRFNDLITVARRVDPEPRPNRPSSGRWMVGMDCRGEYPMGGADAFTSLDERLLYVKGPKISDAVLAHEAVHAATGQMDHDESYYRALQALYGAIY